MEESFEANPDYKSKCFSKACLVRLGAELNVDYMSESDRGAYVNEALSKPGNQLLYPEYYTSGYFIAPELSDFNSGYNFDSKFGDKRGAAQLSTSFLFAFGRTFMAGALNIPINIFYSSKKEVGLTEKNIGFNVVKIKNQLTAKIYFKL